MNLARRRYSRKVRSRAWLADLTRRWAGLATAGLPLDRSLGLLARQERDPDRRHLLTALRMAVEGGDTPGQALARFPEVFDGVYRSAVRAGECEGRLGPALARLAGWLERAERQRRRLGQALLYPAILLGLALVIAGTAAGWVAPRFAGVFRDLLQGAPLPGPTRLLFAVAGGVRTWAGPALAAGAGLVALGAWPRLLAVRERIREFLMDRVPVWGAGRRHAALARAWPTLAVLLRGGVPLPEALAAAAEVAGHPAIRAALQRAGVRLLDGLTLPEALAREPSMPAPTVALLEVGQEADALAEAVERAAELAAEEVERAVTLAFALLEPALLLGLAAVVGSLILALFLPLVSLLQGLGGR